MAFSTLEMGDLCISRSEIRNVLELQNWSQVFLLYKGFGLGILLAREIPMIFNMVKIHSIFCKKMSVWSILLQNGTSAFPGSLYIDFIGHVILDQREASLGTAALYTNC